MIPNWYDCLNLNFVSLILTNKSANCVLADDVLLNPDLGNFFLTFVVITIEHKLLQ